MHFSLILDGLQNGSNVCFQDHSPHDDLIQYVVHAIGMKNEIKFAHVLKILVQTLDKDLNEIENAQIAFLCIHGKDKKECRVVSVNELDALAPLWDDPLEVIAKGVRSLTDLLKDAPHHELLLRFAVDGLIKFGETRIAVIVDNKNALDHDVRAAGCINNCFCVRLCVYFVGCVGWFVQQRATLF